MRGMIVVPYPLMPLEGEGPGSRGSLLVSVNLMLVVLAC